MNIATARYRVAAVLLFGLLLFMITRCVFRTVKDNQCFNGNQRACRFAAQWGYDPKIPHGLYDRVSCQDNGGVWVPNPERPGQGTCIPG